MYFRMGVVDPVQGGPFHFQPTGYDLGGVLWLVNQSSPVAKGAVGQV
jgi:hypothetical protein